MKPADSSLQKSHHPEEGSQDVRPVLPGNVISPQRTGEIELIYHDKHIPSLPPSGGPMGVWGVSGHFLPE